ncbi:MAG: thioredoxin family protein [Ferruginibacter sp.]
MKLLSLSLVFLFVSNFTHAQDTIPSAESILKDAYKQAAAENKNVFVIFHASWCGWCRKMDNAMNDPSCKKAFAENYVIVHLTVEESKDKKDLENPGADLVKNKYLGEKAGLPFWLILDKNGKLLADSYKRKPGVKKDQPGENIGCPTSEDEIAFFTDILQRTSSLSDSKLSTIAKRFKKNKQTIN